MSLFGYATAPSVAAMARHVMTPHKWMVMGRMAGTFRQFEVFVAVCRAKSVSGAAFQLGVSQAAVSRQLAALERRIGVKLFDRSPGRSSTLSISGEAMLENAVQILRLGETMRATVPAEPAIRIGADQMIANLAIKALLDERRTNPILDNVELIEIEPGLDAAAELEAFGLDLLYFTAGPEEFIPASAKLIASAESALYVSPDLWQNLAAGASLSIVLPAGRPRIAAGIRAVLATRLNGPYHVCAEVEPSSALELLLTGLGAGIMNRGRARRLLNAGLLMEVPTFMGPVTVSRYELRRAKTMRNVELVSSMLSEAIKAAFVSEE